MRCQGHGQELKPSLGHGGGRQPEALRLVSTTPAAHALRTPHTRLLPALLELPLVAPTTAAAVGRALAVAAPSHLVAATHAAAPKPAAAAAAAVATAGAA